MDDSKNEIHIDFDSIPDYIKERLAIATMELLRDILSTPEGREKFEKKKAELKAQGRL